MRSAWAFVGHAAWSAALGGVVAVSILSLAVFALVVWLSFAIEFIRFQLVRHAYRKALAILVVQSATMAIVITGAVLAPLKPADRHMPGPVTLPKTVMTLTELEDLTHSPFARYPFKIRVNIYFPKSQAARAVQFPSTNITLGEFVAALEGQTSLRHRFMSCGQGHTILWGGDNFGLWLDVPYQAPPRPAGSSPK